MIVPILMGSAADLEHAQRIAGAVETFAGRSNALRGAVDARVTVTVIACPPYADAFGGADVFSSLRLPSGVAPALVLEPANAALLAAKILALADPFVGARVEQAQREGRQKVIDADCSLRAP